MYLESHSQFIKHEKFGISLIAFMILISSYCQIYYFNCYPAYNKNFIIILSFISTAYSKGVLEKGKGLK